MLRDEQISILQDIIKIKSVNGNEREVALYLQRLLANHGIPSKLIDYAENRSNLVAEIGQGERVLGFTGHMDVVDPGDQDLWTYEPFSAQIEGTKLYGRGSTDMKSGLAAMVIAMIELKEEGAPLEGKIRLLATVGEEVGELGAEQLTKAGYGDDLSGLIIGEPSNYNLIYTHMGSINYTVTSIGKEAHSSMPDQGINAINNLMVFMVEINRQMTAITEKYQDEVLGRTIHNLTVINGGNQVNSIPGEATVQGNIRSLPEFDNDQLITILEKTVAQCNQEKDTQLKLVIDYNKIPVKSPKESHLIQTIQSVHQQKTGETMPLLGVAGTTDAAEFTKSHHHFDFVVFGPGQPDLPHKVNEYVEIDNYLDMIDTYKLVARQYL